MELLDIEDGAVWFSLTAQEADRLLEPYDPDDQDMQSYQHANRHRYLKPDSYDWLSENVGRQNWDWFIKVTYEGVWAAFRDRDKATLFKLTWGGTGS